MRFLAVTDPDVQFTPRIPKMEGGDAYRGHDGVQSWWENLFGVYPDFSTEIEKIRDTGDVTVARLRICGHGAECQAPMEHVPWQVVEWRDNKTIWWGTFVSEAEALEAAVVQE